MILAKEVTDSVLDRELAIIVVAWLFYTVAPNKLQLCESGLVQ